MPDKPEQKVRVPSGPEEIAEILANNLAPMMQALDAIELPDGQSHEPSPAFRVLRTKP